MTGHILIYHPAFIKLRQLINNNYIGKIQFIYSIRVNYKSDLITNDITWDYAPHDISMIDALVKNAENSIQIISIKKKNKISEIYIKLSYQCGLCVNIYLSWHLKKKIQKFKIVGEKKILVFNDINNWNEKLQIYDCKNNHLFNVKIFNKEPLLNECQYFLSSIKNKKNSYSNSRNAEKIITLIEKINNKIYIQNE